MLSYPLHNSAFYLLRAALNALFLVYAARGALFGAALGIGLLSIDAVGRPHT